MNCMHTRCVFQSRLVQQVVTAEVLAQIQGRRGTGALLFVHAYEPKPLINLYSSRDIRLCSAECHQLRS